MHTDGFPKRSGSYSICRHRLSVAEPHARLDRDAAADYGEAGLERGVLHVDVVAAQVELLDGVVARERVEQRQHARVVDRVARQVDERERVVALQERGKRRGALSKE